MTVPGGGCRSLGCRGYLRALLDARISLGTTTRFDRHLPQAHLLVMSLMITILDTGFDETQQAKDLLPLIDSSSSHRQQRDSTGVTGISLACLKQGGIRVKIAVTYSASEKQ